MLHRAILGSLERFIGILIENYAGKFPLWLAPVHVVVATITNETDEYAKKVYSALKSSGIRVELDIDAQKISYKIREHSLKKIPYIVAVGKKEANENMVSVRKIGSDKQDLMKLNDFVDKILLEIEERC